MTGLALALAVSAAAPSTSPSSDGGTWRIIGMAATELDDEDGAWLPLERLGDPVREPVAVVLSAAAPGVPDRALLGAFRTRVEARPDDHGWGLRIDADAAQTSRPGTYKLRVQLRDRDMDHGSGKREDIDVQMVRPPAEIRTPASLVATRVIAPWGNEDSCAEFYLAEMSRRSRAGPLAAFQPEPSSHLDERAAATLVLGLPGIVPPGEHVTVSCRIAGEVEPGVTKGTLRIDAPQLVEAVSLPFEIRARRTGLWVVALLAAGVAFGWLVRRAIEDWIARERTRAAVGEAMLGIQAEAARHGDPALTTRLQVIQRELGEATERVRPAAAAAAIAEAEKKLREALRDFERERAQAIADLGQLAKAVRDVQGMPEPLAAVPAHFAPRLQAIRDSIARDDVTGASRALAAVRQEMADQLREAALPWAEQARAVACKLTAGVGALPASVRSEIDPLQAELQRALDHVPAAQTELDVIRAVRQGLDAERLMLERVREGLARVVQFLGSAEAGSATKSGTLRQARGALERLGKVAGNSEAQVRAAGEVAELVGRAVREVLVEILRDRAFDEVIRALLAKREYEAAVQVARALASPGQPAPRIETPAEPPPAPPALAAESRSPVNEQRPTVKTPPRVTLPAAWARPPNPVARTPAVQRAAILVLTIVGGWFLFSEDFVGTAREMAALFAWAFTTDVGVEGVATLLGRVSRTGGDRPDIEAPRPAVRE